MTSDTAAPPYALGNQSTARWWDIPALAGRMLWRHWPPLLFWFFTMRLSYDLIRIAATWLAGFSILLSYAAVALMIVVQLALTIAMFLAVRPSMRAFTNLSSVRSAGAGSGRQEWTRALSVALLPFFAYYATWGLLDGIRRDFYLNYFFGVSFDSHEKLFDILSIRGLWIAFLVAGGLRWYAKRRHALKPHLGWSILVTACEAYWIFVGAAAISAAWSGWGSWWKGTVAYAATIDWWRNPFVFSISLAPLRAVLDPAWQFVSTLIGAVLLPLVWLAIAATVYGIDLRRRQRIDRADARFYKLAKRYRRTHPLVKKVAGKLTAGWNSKGMPVLNSIRMVLRAGLPALLVLCVGWTLIDYLDAWAWPWLMRALGPLDPQRADYLAQTLLAFVNGPLSMRPALLPEMLRIVLLAAAFDCAFARIQALDKSRDRQRQSSKRR